MDQQERLVKMAIRFGPLLLVILSFVSVLVGVILHSISIDELKYRSPAAQTFEPGVIIDEKLNDVMWFLQVTDLHISSVHNERAADFSEFANTYLDIFKPDAVLVTGDITDGRVPHGGLQSGPQLVEWQAYANVIENSHALNKTKWFDVRGNHDNFNVYRPSDETTMYRKYSHQGKSHPRSYIDYVEKRNESYSFIGLDEVQTPGLKMPFNFLGLVDDDDLSQLERFKEESRQKKSRYNIWFAHYPTSSLASTGNRLREMLNGPYLCGHYHTIASLAMPMYASQQAGYVEVELGDWKDNRIIRLAAVDHQLFSLVDFKFRKFPIALMTNPKTAQHVMPKYEPMDRIQNSTHIRVIAFSNASSISSVNISINYNEPVSMTHSSGPLWVLKWNPQDYLIGLHQAQITVLDSAGQNSTFQQTFSMDNSKDEYSFLVRVLLRAYFRTSVMTLFFTVIVICTLPMLILRFSNYRHRDNGMRRHYKGTFLYNMHLLCKIDRLFWPLFVVPVWCTILPLFLGFMVEDRLGVCFVWGVLVDGTFVHTGLTYNITSIYLLIFHVPATVMLVNQVSNSYKSIVTSNTNSSIINFKLVTHLALTMLQLWIGYLLHFAYGLLSLFTSVPFFWSMVLYNLCWYQCTTIKKKDFRLFNDPSSVEEQQALTNQKSADEANISDQSI